MSADTVSARPCAEHATPQADCGGCRTQAARTLDIIDKLAALAGVTEAGLTAVAGGTQFLAGLDSLLGEELADDTRDIAAELDTAGRALRHIRRILAGLTGGSAALSSLAGELPSAALGPAGTRPDPAVLGQRAG